MTDRLDGRALRREATRKRMAEATRHVLLRYIMENGPRPRVSDIVGIAGVSTRSFFMHFTDMATAVREVLTPQEIASLATAVRAQSDERLVVTFCNWGIVRTKENNPKWQAWNTRVSTAGSKPGVVP